MNIFRRLFKKKSEPVKQPDTSILDLYDQMVIDAVIKALKENPDSFSARWFTGGSLDRSIRSKDEKILILIETGQILSPIEPKMTKGQKELVIELMEPIVKEDIEYLVRGLLSPENFK